MWLLWHYQLMAWVNVVTWQQSCVWLAFWSVPLLISTWSCWYPFLFSQTCKHTPGWILESIRMSIRNQLSQFVIFAGPRQYSQYLFCSKWIFGWSPFCIGFNWMFHNNLFLAYCKSCSHFFRLHSAFFLFYLKNLFLERFFLSSIFLLQNKWNANCWCRWSAYENIFYSNNSISSFLICLTKCQFENYLV